jgi:tetratricopeptide (TPR) repeat protein
MRDEKYKDAIDEIEETLRVCIIPPVEKMSILLTLGNAYYSLSEFEKALKNYNAVLKLAEKIHDKEEVLRIKASGLGNIGLVYFRKNKLDTALKYHKDALKIDREIGYKQGEANQLGNIGLVYARKGKLDTALKYLEKALAIMNRFNLVYGRDVIEKNIDLIKRIKRKKSTSRTLKK